MNLPNFKYEKQLWKKGFYRVAGADEVGRGAFAGPLVAAAVIFPISFARGRLAKLNAPKVNDSKKLTAKQREKANVWIKENCLAWGIGEVPVSIINRAGMAKASKMVFRKAVAECNRRLASQGQALQTQFLLIDAFYIPYTRGIKRKSQLAIIKGDEKSISIAAASIIAKVYRDNLMVSFARRPLAKLKPYRWNKNKGYGTKEHIEAIKRHGATRLHRKAFVKRFLST